MTTVAQVRRAVRPLMERNPDLALVGRAIVVKPVRHLLRGVMIDASSSKEMLHPRWAILPLFDLKETYGLSWGWFLHPPGGFDINDSAMPELMCEAIETQALPMLREVQTSDDFLALLDRRLPQMDFRARPLEMVFFHIVNGDLERAREICDDNHARKDRLKETLSVEKVKRILFLKPFIDSGDRAGLARQLHAWEAQSVKNLKIEHLWEPSPFPLETGDLSQVPSR